ncbi:MAG TPA: peptide-methionine (S)-S-oxide reductase MsrA [Abditibacteriaceae bacterium]|jgi:peptide-methionine (S)-S-oxide reductase
MISNTQRFFGFIVALAFFALVVTHLPRANAGGDTVKATSSIAPPVARQARAGEETATFAAGCFWSVEHMFGQLEGVVSAEPGYAGGTTQNPTYDQVVTGQTGHAETVNVIYDPKVVSYSELLHVFLAIHDPTTLNRQGPDEGTHYRSAIFTRSEAQRQSALAAIAEATTKKQWPNPIVTQVQALTDFTRAEDYHLNYYATHLDEPYCKYVIAPKVKKFHEKFGDKIKK